jgi:hypothetical protein
MATPTGAQKSPPPMIAMMPKAQPEIALVSALAETPWACFNLRRMLDFGVGLPTIDTQE